MLLNVKIDFNVNFLILMIVLWFYGTSLVTQTVKNLPAVWETQVQFLGWEDTLEKGMETQCVVVFHHDFDWYFPND